MTPRRHNSQSFRLPSHFDRRALLFGIVMIPLAASCALSFGTLSLRLAEFARSAERVSTPDMRAALLERERRQHELTGQDEDNGGQFQTGERLHSPQGSAPVAAARVAPSRAMAVRAPFNPVTDRLTASFLSGPSRTRAPPRTA